MNLLSKMRYSVVGAVFAAAALAGCEAAAAWPQGFGGSGDDEVVVTRVAPSGDVFIAGHFRGSFQVGSETLVAQGLQDIFVVRLNAAGTVVWARSAGGESVDTVRDIALDEANNIFVVGEFFGTASFGGSTITAAGQDDGFVARLSVTGSWQWARGMGGSGRDRSTGVVTLPGDTGQIPPVLASVLVVGNYECSASFGGATLSKSNCFSGATDLFAARYSANGDLIWARDRGGSATRMDRADRIAIDANNRVVVVGAQAQGGLVTRLDDAFNNLSNWTSSDANRALVFPGTGSFTYTRTPTSNIFSICFYLGASATVDYSIFNETNHLALRGGNAGVTSGVYDTSGRQTLRISLDAMRGVNYGNGALYGAASELPDGGENLQVQYLGANGAWYTLENFGGGGASGEQFSRQGDAAYTLRPATHPQAFHSGFRLRLWHRTGNGGPFSRTGISIGGRACYERSGLWYDWWHVDNVKLEEVSPPVPFVMTLTNVLSESPVLSGAVDLPASVQVRDIALDRANNRLLLHGSHSGNVDLAGCGSLTGNGAYVASLNLGVPGFSCVWSKSASGASGQGVATDAQGNVYLTGSFNGAAVFNNDPNGSLVANGPTDTDVYIASLDRNGNWRWVTGGGDLDEDSGIPAFAGGFGVDRGLAIATDGVAKVYVGGSFQAVAQFGPADSLAAVGGSDGFVLNLGTDGRFFREEIWFAGVPLTPPPNAETRFFTFRPDFALDGEPFDAIGAKVFAWSQASGESAKLTPLQPYAGIEVRWRVQGRPIESTDRISSLGRVAWPTRPCGENDSDGCYQVHVIGAPVQAEPAAGNFKVLELINPEQGGSLATYSAGSFTAARSGTSVLVYIAGPSLDPQQFPTVVEVVRTLPYSAVPNFVDNVGVEIGKRIVDTYHNEQGRTGWVVNELAYYDGLGSEAAYNRAARTGAIVPVNRYSSARPQEQGRELAVAWYREKSKGVFWPEKAVRYAPFWPVNPDRIIVASQQGGEVLGQQPLNPLLFPSARIYIQNDYNQAGYNPNDEHAFMAPSATGTGFEAVFALRSDFGSSLTGDQAAASDPYVLVKYFDNAQLLWRFRVFQVLATGAGFDSFRFSGTAGTTVSPPYPVRLLPPCGESFVQGQAVGEQPPPPFFQDYKNQLWAKSAGSGSVHYYYPAQAGFFVDTNNDDANDVETGECVPWLARLPATQGGSSSPLDPIRVEYNIVWPAETPLLTAGETLLKPKRGLPDIYNQASVQVVYDAIQDETANPLPSDTLAQLIDPLNPRYVALAQIPESVAKELQTDGTELILGSADGSIKLPASVRQRLRYEPLNRRLRLTGEFDDTIAGEPFLLLNVLSKRDRVALKRLNGGDGSEQSDFTGNCATVGAGCTWDQAVEALFRQSRNPQGITRICLESRLNEQRQRVCDQSRAVTEDDVLIGYQDLNNDGILEPYRATGVNAALSAGLSQGSGYMTIAFNNDPSLNPLPVSLEIIRVGCLISPPPPATPTLVKSYQGQINVIEPDNIFDEQLVLRHSGDFGGNPDALEFEWFFRPDQDGTPPSTLPDPSTGQLNGWIQFPVADAQGAVEISIEGANIQTLSDNWYLARYRGLPTCNNGTEWSLWAGQPGSTPINQRAQLAEGWVKRVLKRLNPFEARVQNFAQAATNNYASMLIQLGERYEGPVALNNDPDNLNSMGLIEAYTTVMRRAMQLSVDSTPPVDYGPANAAILLVASRLVDFYTLLGNEAYADAQDPTIGITTNSGEFSLAPSIFNFQNQLSSLLEEELVLLRGRDDRFGPVAASPVYNRLFWNFTTGDGEVAYALSYNISDQNANGVIDEFDARIMFPQGHGDAWGHYLTGTKLYYELLRHPFYSWNPQTEAIRVAGVPITVDFLDERQFAETAAAKARTGAEIVDLTYRSAFVEDPNGQWQGYEDSNRQRAWGLSEWGRRAGMGAYFDWVTTNAILPDVDPDPERQGIQRIDRTTVSEIQEIAGHYAAIQGQVDKADAGLNPLGLAKGVVPFDIDPSQLTQFNKTQFEQIYDRAMGALNNALKVWDFANELNNQMRRNQNEVDDLTLAANHQETDFANQLIEIFGYPYADDIGPGGAYPAGYNGPDIYHYMYIDLPELAGTPFDFDSGIDQPMRVGKIGEFTAAYTPAPGGLNWFDMTPVPGDNTHSAFDGTNCSTSPGALGCALGTLSTEDALEVEYYTIESPDIGFWFSKPPSWTGQRRAPGRLQMILQQMLQARIALKQAIVDYEGLREEIDVAIETLQGNFDLETRNLKVAVSQRRQLLNLTITTEVMKNGAIVARRIGEGLDATFKTSAECIPKSLIAGFAVGGDPFSGPRCVVIAGSNVGKFALDTVADGLDIISNATEAAKEDVTELAGIRTRINDSSLNLYNVAGEIDAFLRQEAPLRAEIYARTEAIKQLQGEYLATLAEGLRVSDRLISFRKNGAAAVQEYRYQDMAFRIFRNDALQKYRAAFDLAARYVYLAASAYDYETNLLGGDSGAGQAFLTNIVRERSIGQILAGQPVPGTPGLADSMAQLKLNFDVLKGQMGFNNPQVETNRFSLRRELFRITDGPEGDAAWRAKLDSMRVADLWTVPEFRRYARPFAPPSAGPQPGLVIEFTTNVTFGLNFFGWDLGAQDSSYDSSQFATRIRSVGAWFGNYAGLPLADDPRIYLFPVGADVLRAPSAFDFSTREWQVIDQAVPTPFPLGSQDLGRFDWNPAGDTLNGSATEIRRYARLRAFHFAEPFDDSEVTADSRLIGRSVWNRRWMIIIPGGTFLNDPNEGLETFIHGRRIPGSANERDGQGVNDIRVFFKTYAYSGS
jgi:hypothetical protein